MPPEPLKIVPFPRSARFDAGEAPPVRSPAVFEEDLTRLHHAEDREGLCRILAGLLAERGLSDKFTLVQRDESCPEMRIVCSTEILAEMWPQFSLSPGDPVVADVGPGGTFLAGPAAPPRELRWLGMEAPVFAVRGSRAVVDGRPAGCFLLHGSYAVPDAAAPFLEQVLAHAEGALERLQEVEKYRRAFWNSEMALAAMNEMGALMGTLDLRILLTKILELTLRISGAEVGSILIYRHGTLQSRVEWGFSETELNSIRLLDGRPLVQAVMDSDEPEYVANVYLDSRLNTGEDPLPVESIVILPLVTSNGTLGAINVVNVSEESGFSLDRLSTLKTISNLAAIAVENARFHEEALESEKLKEQARIAETIQKGFFPRRIPPFSGFELAGRTAPAQFVGGDYYDFVPLGPGRLGVAVADVSGHGISSGLVMTMTRTLFRAEAVHGAPPAELLRALNTHLTAEDLNGAFVTFMYAVLDSERSELRLSSAGHTPLVHYRAADGSIEHVAMDGLPLGLFPEGDYQERVLKVSPGDAFLFLTDGVVEAMSPRREPFGEDRLNTAFLRLRTLPADDVLQGLHRAVLDFASPGAPHDDISTVLVKVQPGIE